MVAAKIRRDVDWNEAKWRFVSLAYFAIGAMWATILIYGYGTPVFPFYVVAGVVIAGFGMSVSRLLRLLLLRFRRR